jgi:hypothetical protein
MTTTWLASTTQGQMVGDYIATTFVNGTPIPAFAVASAPNGSTLNEALNVETGLSVAKGTVAASPAEVLVGIEAANEAATAAPAAALTQR